MNKDRFISRWLKVFTAFSVIATTIKLAQNRISPSDSLINAINEEY